MSNWTTKKPSVPGAYYVRGFRLGEKESRPALVEVEIDKDETGTLVCNLHQCNSHDEPYEWSFVEEMAERFEWLGPLSATLSPAHVGDVDAWLVVAKYPHKETRRAVFLFEQNADDQGAEWCCDDGVVTITPLTRAALPAAGVPDGWKLVPMEPTIEMIAALGFGGDTDLAIGHGSISFELAASYRAALSSSPPPPTADQGLHCYASLKEADRIAELEAAYKRAEQVINRECQASAAYRMQALELERECERLRERLEINEECPYDGIATRDAAMKFMTQEINSLRSKLENVSEAHDKAWRRAEASEQNLLALSAAISAPPAAGVPEGFVDVMAAVFRELEHRHGDERGNAPRHGHTIPGVWDEDNGELAGKPCAWCALWKKGKEMLKAASAPDHHNDGADSPRSSK